MKAIINQTVWAFIMIIGLLFAINGLFHILFYFIDDAPIFSGMRLLNWSFFILGSAIFWLGLIKVNR